MSPQQVIARRRAERAALIARAERFAQDLDPQLGARAVVVFGSVARGDFNVWSDVDVLVVAERLPERALDRLAALGKPPDAVEPVAWTPAEWRRQRRRSNPIAVEAVHDGVWLVGSPEALDDP
ncbi:MAG TPA: nucleotidyltransferase domain-containing protein [Egibacteraceae bacterium]|nr:nucleotidyltransferase domain-containing protein [Egibacteraceae bacterium]